jgi:hypothetical protein
LHELPHTPLKRTCLPIPPLVHRSNIIATSTSIVNENICILDGFGL